MKFIEPSQNICCDDVIQCIFNLNNLDIAVYKKLRSANEARADGLAKQLRKERSTVYRSLQKLTCVGLISKKIKNIPKGGYYHIYQCTDNIETKKRLEECIDQWYEKMKDTIKDLDK